jgi:glycosyltransferase involved in cell wall biosynthesis
MAKTLIYTLSWNRLEYTQRCVEAVKRHTPEHLCDHLVVDQGSEHNVSKWLIKNHKISMFLNENIGIIRARNLVHETYPDYDYYVKLDNDCEIQSDGWLERMLAASEDPERPRDLMLSLYVRGLVANKGGVARGLPDGHPQRFEKYNISYSAHIGGICMFYAKQMWIVFLQ